MPSREFGYYKHINYLSIYCTQSPAEIAKYTRSRDVEIFGKPNCTRVLLRSKYAISSSSFHSLARETIQLSLIPQSTTRRLHLAPLQLITLEERSYCPPYFQPNILFKRTLSQVTTSAHKELSLPRMIPRNC